MWCKISGSNQHLADKVGAFYTGSNNFGHPLFEEHEKSKEHVNVANPLLIKKRVKENC